MADIFLGSTVRPGGPFPITEDTDTKGGFQVVPDNTARDAIFANKRKYGMEVFVQSTGILYQLAADLVTWNEITFSAVVSKTTYTCPAGVAVRDLVYVTPVGDTVDQASATSAATAPTIGIAVFKPTPTSVVVGYAGEVVGFSGLTPGVFYYMSTVPGQIVKVGDVGFPTTDGQILQPVGRSRSATTLVFSPLFFIGM